MRHHIFEEADRYTNALLCKSNSFSKAEVLANYVEPLVEQGVRQDEVIAFTLSYNDIGKAPATFIKAYLDELLPTLQDLSVKRLYVADAAYFKVLAGQARAEPHLGYVLPCKIKGYEDMSVILGLNYQQLIFNPELQAKLDLSLKTLADAHHGSYQAIGKNVIHSAAYPQDYVSIKATLQALHQHPRLMCDIEAFSLRFNKAGIGTIAFAWDQHNGIAFACDYAPYTEVENGLCGYQYVNLEVRQLLIEFFTNYQGELVFHNATYDIKVIVATLWMKNLLDTAGCLDGLEIMTQRFQDTKIIAYLATNSTAGNVLGLKALAHEFAGNWAVEVKDIRKVPLTKLLEYNLVDALCTQYVFNKHHSVMVQDKQLQLYEDLMLPSLKLIIQMELEGMPMSPETIEQTKAKLKQEHAEHLSVITNSSQITMLNLLLQRNAQAAANTKLKTKQHPLEKFKDVCFNPNSGIQLQKLLYVQMGLPVLDYTDTKQPATGADTLEKLVNHASDPDAVALLTALVAYGKVSKILSTFIPAFEKGLLKADGMRYLHGSFNLGGTVSGRLSSSDPNMQNLPAGSTFGKLIKQCFQAPPGWLFCGADFNSLEDYISALTTKDKNKLAVYEQGFDGHCLRAAYYFRDQCPEIILSDPTSVNTIKKKYPQLRQDSKGPTFLLTYGGTYHGMMNNLGWPEDKSKAIEKGYHDLYKESDDYVQARLHQAASDGYVEVAFGLRVRTPLLKQVMFGKKGMPYEAAAEGRTAGNALGQSYGLLNNRAAVAFMGKVWASPYRLDIKPVALIHDAIYLLIRDDVAVVEWANKELIIAMQWQELPEIQHPTVKLGAALDIFWPTWATATTLPNEANQDTIRSICDNTKKEFHDKHQIVVTS